MKLMYTKEKQFTDDEVSQFLGVIRDTNSIHVKRDPVVIMVGEEEQEIPVDPVIVPGFLSSSVFSQMVVEMIGDGVILQSIDFEFVDIINTWVNLEYSLKITDLNYRSNTVWITMDASVNNKDDVTSKIRGNIVAVMTNELL